MNFLKRKVEIYDAAKKEWNFALPSEIGPNTVYRTKSRILNGNYTEGTFISVLGEDSLVMTNIPKSRILITDASSGFVLPVYPSIKLDHFEIVVTILLHKGFYLYPSEFIYCLDENSPTGWSENELRMMLHIANRLGGATRPSEYRRWCASIMSIIDHHDDELKRIQDAMDE